MAAFPTTLPAPLLDGYALSPVDQTARTDMEAGAARVRRRTRARNDVLDVSWRFTQAQMAAFRSWFEDGVSGIAGGSSWFSVTVDVGGGALEIKECRFKGAWKAEREHVFWKVTAQLEVR